MLVSVSYTHLDVYKRQVYFWSHKRKRAPQAGIVVNLAGYDVVSLGDPTSVGLRYERQVVEKDCASNRFTVVNAFKSRLCK